MIHLEGIDRLTAGMLSGVMNGVLPGVLLVAAVWGVMRWLIRPVNATTRYLVWSATLAVCVGIMVVYFRVDPGDGVAETPHREERASLPPAPAKPEDATSVAADAPRTSISGVEAPAVRAMPGQVARRIEGPSLSLPWRQGLLALWALIACALLLRVGIGWAKVRRMKARSRQAPAPVLAILDRALQRALQRTEASRAIRLGISDEIGTAAAIGFATPTILVPQTMIETLDEEELEQVVLHEAAHLLRRDDYTMLIQHVIVAIFFFHPGVLLLSRWMSRDREFAADDWVVALTRRPRAYAACLVKLTQQRARSLSFAPGMGTRKNQLIERVTTILDRERPVSRSVSQATFLAILAGSLVFAGAAVRLAPVIAIPVQEAMAQPSSASAAPVAVMSPSSASDTTGPAGAPVASVAPDRAVPPSAPAAAATVESVQGVAPVERIRPVAVQSEPVSPADAIALPEPAHDVRRVDPGLSAASIRKLLLAAGRIASSGDRAQILVEASVRLPADDAVYEAYIETASAVPSSGDRLRALTALIEGRGLNPSVAASFLAAAKGIPSQGDRGLLLERALERGAIPLDDEATRDAFFDVAQTLSSDTFKRITTALIKRAR
ncbi:MAG: M56 family metallopeptidase [Rhodothermales bacterium]